MIFNWERKLMKLLRIPAFYLLAVLAVGICTSTGQTNAPVPVNAPRVAPSGGVRGSNVHATSSNILYVARGPANVNQRAPGTLPSQVQNQSIVLLPNYSPLSRQLNPRLAAMRIQQQLPTASIQPTGNLLPRTGIVQPPLPILDDQPMARTDELKPINAVSAKREISEGLETINASRLVRNGSAQPIVDDSVNRDFEQHKVKKNQQPGKNRFSYSDALRHNWHEWHHRDWWRQHCNNVVFVTGGYYFLDASYWYPAYGYDPGNSYYDYDGPIYTYSNLLPDQVIANVQGALQNAGYYFGPVTGSLSVETRAALANFQRDQGLIVTGAIDEPTVEALGLY
jgi:hypothetical protein